VKYFKTRVIMNISPCGKLGIHFTVITFEFLSEVFGQFSLSKHFLFLFSIVT
jgi:hypothetical protein